MVDLNGWVKLHRKINNTSFKRNPLVVALFMHILTNVNHEDTKIIWNKKEMNIKAGSFITGRKVLSFETGISEQSIRTCLDVLKSTSTITITAYSKFSVISINNWCEYQETTSKLTNNQPATNQQLTTNKNVKNDKNIKNIHISKVKTYFSKDKITEEQIDKVVDELKVSKEVVMDMIDSMDVWSNGKGNTALNWYLTLRNWIGRGIKEGKIKQINNYTKSDDKLIQHTLQVRNLGFDQNAN